MARELGDCTGAGGARHIASHLPLGLRQIWVEETRDAGRPSNVGAEALIARLQSRLGLTYRAEAEILFTLVCAWLKHLSPEERDDVAAVLSPELQLLWEGARLPLVPPWRRLVIPAAQG